MHDKMVAPLIGFSSASYRLASRRRKTYRATSMPRRNLAIILIAAILSIACYGRAQRNRFASLFAEAVHRISSSYVREVDERQLFEDAMQGMLGQLDPYSTYIGPEQYLEFKSDIDQEFGGIGIIVSPNPKTKTIISYKISQEAHT